MTGGCCMPTEKKLSLCHKGITLSPDDVVSRALRELKEYATQEEDPEKLHELVIEINQLLDIIEIKMTKIDAGNSLTI